MIRLLRYVALLTAGALAALRLRRRSANEGADTGPGAEIPNPAEEGRTGRFDWKRRLRTVAAFLAVLAVGGVLVVAVGLVPLKASSGHWAITRWFLSWSMSRSVSTYSIGIDAPSRDSLSNRLLVLKGAGHYETGCQPCHGSPALRHPRVAQAMTPHPPYLPPEISRWDPEELFYIVKHGVKFTGMPAWPAQERNDEVWAMVAFLLTLPDLDAKTYRQLVTSKAATTTEAEAPIYDLLGPADASQLAASRLATESCAHCHGVGGEGRELGAFPRLAGQRPTYLYNALRAYARGERHSGIMEPVAASLSRGEMRALARYYGGQEEPALQTTPPAPTRRAATPAIKRGRAIALQGIPSQRVPSCVDCHGPGSARRNPAYPLLAGQYADYLALQLKLFREERRGGSVYARLMHPTAHRLTPEEVHDVTLYYESLKAVPDQPAQ